MDANQCSGAFEFRIAEQPAPPLTWNDGQIERAAIVIDDSSDPDKVEYQNLVWRDSPREIVIESSSESDVGGRVWRLLKQRTKIQMSRRQRILCVRDESPKLLLQQKDWTIATILSFT